MLNRCLFLLLVLLSFKPSFSQTCIGSATLKNGPGAFQWMETAGDNLLVCGGVYYTGSFTYDGNTIIAPPGAYATCYVVMTDTSFNLIRLFNHVSFFTAGGAFNDLRIWGMTIDPDKNVLFTGSYTDSLIVYGNDTILSDDYQEGFVAKSDSVGQPLFFKSFGSRHFSAPYRFEDRGHCITTDANGNIFVGASFDGDYLLVNSDTVHNGTSVGLNGYRQAAVFSLTPDGQTTRWIKAFGTRTQDDTPFGIAVNSQGRVTICGSTTASNQDFIFGNIVYHYKSSPSGFQAFNGQFDSTGNAMWFYPVETYVGTGPDVSAYDIAVDGNGNSYIAGFFDGYVVFNGDTIKTQNYTSAYLLKLDSNGQRMFLRVGNIDTFYPYPLALKLKGDKVMVTGQCFTNRLIFEPYGLCCSRDVFFTMYDTSGTVLYLKGLEGSGGVNVAGYDVAFTASGCGLACGAFSGGTISIEPNTATTAGTDYYLVRFGDTPSNGLSMTLNNNGSDTIACGLSTQLQMSATPSANTRYFWSADNDTIPGPFYNATLSATPKLNTTYYAVAYNNTCVVMDSINVYVEPIPVDAGMDTITCEQQAIQLQGSVLTNATYLWSPSAYVDVDTVSNPIFTPQLPIHQMIYQVTSAQGCINSDTILINIYPLPVAGFFGSVNGLQLTLTDTSLYGLNYSWNFGDSSPVDTVQNPVHTYSSPGTYSVTLTVDNDCGQNFFMQSFTMTNVGVEELNSRLLIIDKQNELEIYSDYLGSTTIKIYDLSGKCLLQQQVNQRLTRLNKSFLVSGIYVLTVSDGRELVHRKFFK